MRPESVGSSLPARNSFSTPSTNGTTFKIPRKRPVASSSERGNSPHSNGIPSRPSSTASSGYGPTRQSHHLSQSPDWRPSAGGAPQQIVFPKANVIEPALLLSYLTQSGKSSQPSVLLLDVRPKELYETGCLNADHVVWIDPILLDEE
jgi:hypothetical protein